MGICGFVLSGLLWSQIPCNLWWGRETAPTAFLEDFMARSPAPLYDRMEFPDYVFVEYPKMLYGPGGITTVVASAKDEAALKGDWFTTPGEAAAVE